MRLPPVYGILDGSILLARGVQPGAVAEAWIDAGLRLIQIRSKAGWNRQVFESAERVRDLCRSAEAALIVNDRPDVALLLDAGVHVGQDDLSPSDARRIVGDQRIVGFSTHNEQQFVAANREPVDYIAFGPIYGTASKENPDPVTGLDALRRFRTLTAKPVVAIGGITREKAPEVWRAGADSVAIIADLYPAECTRESLHQRAAEWMRIARYEQRH